MANGVNVGTAYVRIEPSAKGIGNKISDVLNNEASGAGEKAGSRLASGIGSALKVGGAVIGAGITAATAAVTGFAKEAVSSYASYEQLIGGVEKLYGDAAGKIEQFAEDAYKTSGMSANQYMETATNFSASLINSLGGDVNKAAEMTDVAMRAMSDNVNVFGSDMESVQNVFSGLSKGQYQLLDNLKLGFTGTKEGAQELIKAAAGMTEEQEKLGLSVDDTSLSFDNMIAAIAVVQENMGIAGATASEAMGTIEGSATATKAAWENVITAIGRGEGMQEAFDGLLTSIFGGEDGGGLLNNILPRIQQVMEGIGEFVSQAAPIIVEKLPALIEGILPSLLSAGTALLEGLVQGILAALPELMPIAIDVVMQFIGFVIDNLPMIVSCGVELIVSLVNGIAEALPELIPAAIDAILTIVDSLIDNIDLLVDCAAKLIIGLAEGLIKAIPTLITKIPIIIGKLVAAIIKCDIELVKAGKELLTKMIEGIKNIGQQLPEVGRNLIEGFKNGVIERFRGLVDEVKQMANNLISSVKNVFQTHSPSRVFEQIGDYCVQGFDNAFESFGGGALTSVEDAMSNMAGVDMPTLETSMSMSASSYRSIGNDSSNVYALLAQYLPLLLDRGSNVNVSLEGDAEGLFRQIRTQTNRFIKSTGASPFIAPA